MAIFFYRLAVFFRVFSSRYHFYGLQYIGVFCSFFSKSRFFFREIVLIF